MRKIETVHGVTSNREINKRISKNVCYCHFDVSEGTITVAGVYIFNGIFKSVEYGLSFCSPEDNFCRKTGRLNALKNLFNLRSGLINTTFRAGSLDLSAITDSLDDMNPNEVLALALNKHLKRYLDPINKNVRICNNFPRWIKSSNISFRGKAPNGS